jgi:hypothetical protein
MVVQAGETPKKTRAARAAATAIFPFFGAQLG